MSEETQNTEDFRFEEALGRLEAILESMETGEVPLEDLVVKYEEGVQLLKACHARLNEAELKIATVQQDDGVLESAPMATEKETESAEEDA